MSISAALLPEFDQEMANTRKMLERVPEDKPAYRPHEKSMPLSRLAGHVAELPSWATVTLDRDLLELTAGMQPAVMTTRQALLEVFDKHVAEARAAIAKASDADCMKLWTMRFNGKDMFSMPKIAVIRGMVMNHLIHHRAQLGVYLRLLDVAVPGMYGPSADEAQWWKEKPA